MTEANEEPPYDGAFVVIEPIPVGYRVRLELPPGCDLSRACPSKDEAWLWAQCLWSTFKLPIRDFTNGMVARGAE